MAMSILATVLSVSVCIIVGGVRIAKRRDLDSFDNFSFHFEPAFRDTKVCDSGFNLDEAQCQEAFEVIKDRTKHNNNSTFRTISYPHEGKKRKPNGCMMDVSDGGWRIYHNSYKGRPRQRKGEHGSGFHKTWLQLVRLCSGAAQDQLNFFGLGDEGKQTCHESDLQWVPLGPSDCLVAGLQEVLKGKEKRELMYRHEGRVHNGELKWNGWIADDPNIPKGCSMRTKSDWNFFFKTSDGAVGEHMSLVCQRPPSQRVQVVSSLVAGSHTDQQNRSLSTWGWFRAAACCLDYTCNTCSSRRRHATTATTKCPWYADLGCCSDPQYTCR